jgi:aspartyl-tRNA(Asn)/glutamyl-tRNA(Gln) amidotransferase subunit A
MKLADYVGMSAIQMARGIGRGDLSPVELVRAALAAIDATDASVNAYSEVFAKRALTEAAILEAEARRGQLRGPLHGVPFAVKDLFNVEGTCTRRGSLLYADSASKGTAPAVERMFAAGAVMVGKTTTAELGWKASSNSRLTGVTRNPWKLDRTAGGSSSGSGAAVAAGTVPIALGSDGGGSLRIPAAFCGVVSMKAHLGRVPTYPPSASEHLSHAGAMTRSVADSALALDVLAGPDPRDPNSLPPAPVRFSEAATRGRPLRCAFAPTLFGASVDTDVARVVRAAIDRIAALPNIELVETTPDWDDPIEIFEALWIARGSVYLHLCSEDREKLDPGLARMVERSAAITIADHLNTLQRRADFCRRVANWFEDFDLLLLPTVPIQPFDAERDGPADMDQYPTVPWARWTPFSYPFNLTGQPAASVPCGLTDTGLPVGLQVVGRRFDEDSVLALCEAWERSFDWRRRHPPVFAGQLDEAFNA